MLAGILGGLRFDPSWVSAEEAIDFFDGKGVLETVLERLLVEATFQPGQDRMLLPGRTAGLVVSGQEVGVLGEVHPKIAALFDIATQPVVLFEVDLEKLLPFTGALPRYQPVPRFPGIARDIALVVDADIEASKVQGIIQGFPLVSQVILFDVYAGEKVPKDKKSLAFSLLYRSPERTLTDAEVDRTQQRMLEQLQRELGATLRT